MHVWYRETGKFIQKWLNAHPTISPSSPHPKVQNQTTALLRGLKTENHSSVSVIFSKSGVPDMLSA